MTDTADVRGAIPSPTTQILGPDGRITDVWWRYLLTLFTRTGGTEGNNSADLAALISTLNGKITQLFGITGHLQIESTELQMQAQEAIPVLLIAVLVRRVGDLERQIMTTPATPTPAVQVNDQASVYAHNQEQDGSLHAVATPSANGFLAAQDKTVIDALHFPLASATPANNGELAFQLTSNTQLTIKVKGSDGVVRSANLTLA